MSGSGKNAGVLSALPRRRGQRQIHQCPGILLLFSAISRIGLYAATKFSFGTGEAYSAATAEVSNSIVVAGGRNAAVSDFVNAVSQGNKAVVADLPGNAAWDPLKGRVDNASRYLTEQVQGFFRDGKLPHPECGGITTDFLTQNIGRINNLVLFIDGSDPLAAQQAAQHLMLGEGRAIAPTVAATAGLRKH